jgi:hypothetical protein
MYQPSPDHQVCYLLTSEVDSVIYPLGRAGVAGLRLCFPVAGTAHFPVAVSPEELYM